MISSKNNLSHVKYRPDIDGLRAFSVFFVIGYHAFPEIFKAGFIGVDIFFVISGYLISSIIISDLKNKNFSFLDFYIKRIKRIFPALILVLISCFIFGWFALFPIEFNQLGKHIAGSASFIPNFILWDEAGYFDNTANTKPLLHIWSLGIEEQFYFFWPLLLWFFFKIRINFTLSIIFLIIISFCFNVYESNYDKVASFYSPITRFWELLIGSFLALIIVRKKRFIVSNLSSNFLSIMGPSLIFLGFFLIDDGSAYPGILAIFPVIGSFFIILAGNNAIFNRIILSNKILVWFGLISFPLYLWHWPLISFARIIESDFPNENYRIISIIISIILAWITYKFLEKPIRSTKSRIIPITLILIMIGVGLAGFYSFNKNGVPNRSYISSFNEENFKMAFLFKEDNPVSHKNCMETYGLKDFIRYCNTTSSKKATIALIGDSHARALYDGLAFSLKKYNLGLLNLGGRLFLDVETYPKDDLKEIQVYKGGIKATQFVIDDPSIETIIMVSKGHYLTNQRWNFNLISNPAIKDKKEVWEIAMRKTLDAALTKNKNVIFIIDNPSLGFDPKLCIYGRPFSKNTSIKKSCTISRSSYESESKVYRKLVFSILNEYPKVKVLNTADILCDDKSCYGMLDGKILYRDNDHLSLAGGKLLSKELIKLLNLTEN